MRRTPIQEALSQHRLHVTQYLLSQGAEMTIIKYGTVWNFGLQCGYSEEELEEYLKTPLDQKIQNRIQLVSNAFKYLPMINTFSETLQPQSLDTSSIPAFKGRRLATVSGMNVRNSFLEKERYQLDSNSGDDIGNQPLAEDTKNLSLSAPSVERNSKWQEKIYTLGGLKGIKKTLTGIK
ncbi:hypothetical protein HK096_011443 [Nowakowskiella sp. JEL0078]|nr:hypothetical protein HK096_011443 [Nowakowskiella sp. JEL0078]